MKSLNIRQVRGALSTLDRLVAEEGEILVTRRGRPLARIVAASPNSPAPSHAGLRARMPRLITPSEDLVRADRDGR